MPGVRLHHSELRNCTYTLIHFGRPLKAPMECWVCGLIHVHKTYHLGLDQVGDVVVSETVYRRLEEAGLDGLRATKEEKDPEPVVVDMREGVSAPIVISREGGKDG